MYILLSLLLPLFLGWCHTMLALCLSLFQRCILFKSYRKKRISSIQLVYSPDVCNNQDWVKLKPRVWNFIWLPHVSGRDPNTWSILCCFPRHISRIRSRVDGAPTSYWDTGCQPCRPWLKLLCCSTWSLHWRFDLTVMLVWWTYILFFLPLWSPLLAVSRADMVYSFIQCSSKGRQRNLCSYGACILFGESEKDPTEVYICVYGSA